jgi:hypothetical protein
MVLFVSVRWQQWPGYLKWYFPFICLIFSVTWEQFNTAISCSLQELHTGPRPYGKVGVMETVAIVKTSKMTYNAYPFTKHKKVYLTTHSKTSLAQSIKKSTKNVQQCQSRCYKPGLDAITWLSSSAVTSLQ